MFASLEEHYGSGEIKKNKPQEKPVMIQRLIQFYEKHFGFLHTTREFLNTRRDFPGLLI